MASASTLPAGLRGMNLLNSPVWNKGTGFTEEEREAFGLEGLLPPYVETLQQQSRRAYESLQMKPTDLERHIYLRALQDTNEVSFYRLLLEHVEETLPLVYTPTVAKGCELFSHIYRRPRGMFLPYPRRGLLKRMLANRPHADVDVIVVTDGERILGIGDQGVGGLGIPIGKLSLYTLIGGIHPMRTLPVVLDVGTNNQDRLNDPEYLGWRHERISGQDYFGFIENFVDAVKQELPNTLLQWEDFATAKARPILKKYQDQLATFNDDIQGTAAVTLAALIGASKAAGKRMRDHHLVFLGAGSAAIGVADYLRRDMVHDGLSDQEARRRFWMIDKDGLLLDDRNDLREEEKTYTQPRSAVSSWAKKDPLDLTTVIKNVPATVLIGLSTAKNAFTEEIVRDMARKADRPIIFPLSNPTDRSEAEPADLIQWTDGKALVATGSPFAPVQHGNRTIQISQCNNVYIFPAVGLGVVAARSRRVTDDMLIAASRALSERSPALKDPNGALLPPVGEIRDIALEIAAAVAAEARRSGLAQSQRDPEEQVRAIRWNPEYRPIARQAAQG